MSLEQMPGKKRSERPADVVAPDEVKSSDREDESMNLSPTSKTRIRKAREFKKRKERREANPKVSAASEPVPACVLNTPEAVDTKGIYKTMLEQVNTILSYVQAINEARKKDSILEFEATPQTVNQDHERASQIINHYTYHFYNSGNQSVPCTEESRAVTRTGSKSQGSQIINHYAYHYY